MRVAIVHYWLVSMRGGEKVVEALCDMYPDADIFTLVCDHDKISNKLRGHRIFTSFLQRIPGAKKRYQSMLPLMPFALEGFDLSGYDLILSSESGPAKGIIPPPQAVHICYCHSPMRYIWDHYHLYRRNVGFVARMMMPLVAPLMRAWDANSSLRVDHFVANSHHVASRIAKYYRRSSVVLHPPVAVAEFAPVASVDDFYLCAGQIVPYKRIDLAVRTFTKLQRNLVVVGDGDSQDIAALKRIAGPTIRFTGPASFSELKDYLARCRALIFPGEEDFGIVPVEAMASGRPVIAYGRGGALDTIVPGRFHRALRDHGTQLPSRTHPASRGPVQRRELQGRNETDHRSGAVGAPYRGRCEAICDIARPRLRGGEPRPPALSAIEGESAFGGFTP